jgi:hypothetical protein
MLDSILAASFEDLSDAYDDFVAAPFQLAGNVLERFVVAFGTEPLKGFLGSVLPPVEFSVWLDAIQSSRGGVGSGRMVWSADRAKRVAMQRALIEYLAANQRRLPSFVHEFCNSGRSSIAGDLQNFAELVLRPFIRDVQRLTENRAVPPILFDAMGSLPPSGDATLDQLLAEAIARFRDPAPGRRKEGLERLWDAWERLKTIDHASNKRLSVTALLDRAAEAGPFREVLENESRSLTDVGNTFHIRHFETGRVAVRRDSHVDYLFHRLFALIHLLLYARTIEDGA